MHKFYLYFSGISVLVCLSASIVFSSVFRNTLGGIFAGFAALVAAKCFVLHCLYFSNKLHMYYRQETLKWLNHVGFVIVLLASAFVIWFIFAMVYWKIPLLDYQRTELFPCVFSFISGKWGLHMYSATKEYIDYLNNYSPITQTV